MKIYIEDYSEVEAFVKIDTSSRRVILEDVFTGVGIKTDQGLFGIAQREDGIEVMLDGKMVWSSNEHT